VGNDDAGAVLGRGVALGDGFGSTVEAVPPWPALVEVGAGELARFRGKTLCVEAAVGGAATTGRPGMATSDVPYSVVVVVVVVVSGSILSRTRRLGVSITRKVDTAARLTVTQPVRAMQHRSTKREVVIMRAF